MCTRRVATFLSLFFFSLLLSSCSSSQSSLPSSLDELYEIKESSRISGYTSGYDDGFSAGYNAALEVQSPASRESESKPSFSEWSNSKYGSVPVESSLTEAPISHGEIIFPSSFERTCPFTVSTDYSANGQDGHYYFIESAYVYLQYFHPYPKLTSSDTRVRLNSSSPPGVKESDVSFFCLGGLSASVDVPPGVYRLWYCTGTKWYGVGDYFGDSTKWYTSDEYLSFYEDDYYSHGLTITLSPTLNGNLDTYEVDASELPF